MKEVMCLFICIICIIPKLKPVGLLDIPLKASETTESNIIIPASTGQYA